MALFGDLVDVLIMSKYRKDLIPVKVYFRDGSCYEIKIGALANCKDTLYELIRTLRQSPKLKASDHLLKYFTICSVTGPSGLGTSPEGIYL